MRSLEPFISSVGAIRDTLAWGIPSDQALDSRLRPSKPQEERVEFASSPRSLSRNAIMGSALGEATLHAMKCVEGAIRSLFQLKDAPSEWPGIATANKQLETALQDLTDISGISCEVMSTPKISDCSSNNGHHSEGPLSVVVLVRIARQISQCLSEIEKLRVSAGFRSQLQLPRISLAWFGILPGPFLPYDQDDDTDASENPREPPEYIARFEEIAKGEARNRASELSEEDHRSIWRSIILYLSRLLWTNDRMIGFRLRLWSLLRSVQRSHHLHHALKNALGVTLLTIPAFFPKESPWYQWYQNWHGQWMTIRYERLSHGKNLPLKKGTVMCGS